LLHPTLQRQLARLGLSPEAPPSLEAWAQFLERASQAHQEVEQDRHLLERSLAISNDELRQVNSVQSLILDNSAVAISFVRNQVFEWVNSRMPELFGFPIDQLRGSPTRIIFPSDGAYEWIGFETYPMLALGRKVHLELEMQRADGTLFWCRTEVKALHPSNPQDGSVWIWEDITARKTAEDELRSLSGIQSLILDNSTVGIAFVRHRVFEWVNPRLPEMLGLTPAEIQGAPTRIIYPSDERFQAMDSEVYESLAKGKWFELEISMPHAGGFPCSSRIQGKALDPARIQDGSIWIFEDITERKRSEEALRQGQKLESLGVLAGGIAHDFNNLLTAILGNIQLSQMELADTDLAMAPLISAEKAVLKASDLTKQMLAYSGRGRFVVKPHDLNQVVQEMTDLLRVSISKKITLAFELAPALPILEADAAQLHQVILNLVTNASDAMGENEGQLTVRTASEVLDETRIAAEFPAQGLAPGAYVLLEVSDTGCGMSLEVQARIFDPFFTTKTKGRGLGLSAMLGILKGHRAGIAIESVVDKGTSFRILFPALQARPQPQVEPSETAPLSFQGRVLLVDDEPAILATISRALKGMGFSVRCAQDGREALEAMAQPGEAFDLALLDLNMPRMGGRETFHAIHLTHPHLPVLLCSGYDEQQVVEELTQKGLAGFIQKPYQLKELRRAIAVAMAENKT